MDELMEEGSFNVMDVPFYENCSWSKRLDGSSTVMNTFYCIDEDVACAESVYCKELSTPYPMYFEDTFKKDGILFKLHLSGVKVRVPDVDDFILTCHRLNIKPPSGMTLFHRIIKVFHYLSSWTFVTQRDIESFCEKHGLGFFCRPTIPFHENLIAFRNFLHLQIPIKISVVDGQHRVMSVITAYENCLVSEHYPLRYRKEIAVPLPPSSEIFKHKIVHWMYASSLAKQKELIVNLSDETNESGRTNVDSLLNDVISTKLRLLDDDLYAEVKKQILYLEKYRFEKPKNPVPRFEPANADHYFEVIVWPFAQEIMRKLQHMTEISIPSNVVKSWLPEGKYLKSKVKSICLSSAWPAWTNDSLKNHFPLPLGTFLEPALHCYLSPAVAKNFQSIYGNFFQTIQRRLIEQTPRDPNHDWKCVQKNVFYVLEFLYHGFQRPVDYLVHLLTEVANGFLWGMRMMSHKGKNGNPIRDRFLALQKQEGKKLWPKFPEMVDPYIYFDYIVDVDAHHFPGMHQPNSAYAKFEESAPNIRQTGTPHQDSLVVEFGEYVEEFFKQRPNKSTAAHLKDQGYAAMALAVRQAVYDQILPVIAQFGLDPVFNREVSPEIKKLIST